MQTNLNMLITNTQIGRRKIETWRKHFGAEETRYETNDEALLPLEHHAVRAFQRHILLDIC